MTSLMKSFLLTAASAGASYLWRNRASLPSLRGRTVAATSPSTDRGVTIYHNHPVAG
jgi:hypothetical protein